MRPGSFGLREARARFFDDDHTGTGADEADLSEKEKLVEAFKGDVIAWDASNQEIDYGALPPPTEASEGASKWWVMTAGDYARQVI